MVTIRAPRETWMVNLENMLVAGGVRDADLSWSGMCVTIDPPSILPDSGIHIQFAMGTLTKKNSFRSHIQRLISPQGDDLNRSGLLGKGFFWPQLRKYRLRFQLRRTAGTGRTMEANSTVHQYPHWFIYVSRIRRSRHCGAVAESSQSLLMW